MKSLILLTFILAWSQSHAAYSSKENWKARGPWAEAKRQNPDLTFSEFCDRDLDLLDGKDTQNLATVTKLTKTRGYAVMNVRGQPMSIGLLLKNIQGSAGKTWEDNKIQTGSHILVDWKAWRTTTASKISTGRVGSAPATITHIGSDGMIFIETNISSEPIMLATSPSVVHDLGKRSLEAMNLKVGGVVWVKWNPENGDVESVVP